MSFGAKGNQKQEPLFWQFVLGGSSSGSAACITHPLDTIKVRQQLLKGQGQGMLGTAKDIVSAGGPMGLYKGLSASLLRQLTYSGARIGSYPPIKSLLQGDEPFLSFPKKLVAGMLAGAVGAAVGNPGDLINVRMQGDASLPPEARRNYKNVVDGLIRVIREEGVLALWRGSQPNVYRSMFMTSSQLAAYDQIKQLLVYNTGGLFVDNVVTHLVASSAAGFIATVVCSPVDVVKTKIFFDRASKDQKPRYRGMLDCFAQTLREDGVRGMFKGFVPSCTRLVPHTILTLMFYEQYAKLLSSYRSK